MIKKHLKVLKSEFTIHRFNASDSIPDNVYKSKFYWIGKPMKNYLSFANQIFCLLIKTALVIGQL